MNPALDSLYAVFGFFNEARECRRERRGPSRCRTSAGARAYIDGMGGSWDSDACRMRFLRPFQRSILRNPHKMRLKRHFSTER